MFSMPKNVKQWAVALAVGSVIGAVSNVIVTPWFAGMWARRPWAQA